MTGEPGEALCGHPAFSAREDGLLDELLGGRCGAARRAVPCSDSKCSKASRTAPDQPGALVLKPGLRAVALLPGYAQVSRTKRRVFADDGCDADGRGLIGDSQKGPIALTDCLFTLSDQKSSQTVGKFRCSQTKTELQQINAQLIGIILIRDFYRLSNNHTVVPGGGALSRIATLLHSLHSSQTTHSLIQSFVPVCRVHPCKPDTETFRLNVQRSPR